MQPLTSASGGYSAAALEAQLRAGNAACGCRFDLLDQGGGLLGSLATGQGGVTAATVTRDTTQALNYTLTLSMTADSRLYNVPFLRRIRPWYRLRMPDGGIAEWPMGVFMWVKPPRTLDAVNRERWDNVTLADVQHRLDAGGPGIGGYAIAAGTVTTAALATVYALAGFTDTSGIVPSTSITAAPLVFDVMTSQGPTTWRTIADALTASIGYYPTWFDATGVPRAIPQPDLTSATPTMTYATTTNSIIVPPLNTTNDNLDQIANRIIARASNTGGFTGAAVADLNTLIPAHPLAENTIGFYIEIGRAHV